MRCSEQQSLATWNLLERENNVYQAFSEICWLLKVGVFEMAYRTIIYESSLTSWNFLDGVHSENENIDNKGVRGYIIVAGGQQYLIPMWGINSKIFEEKWYNVLDFTTLLADKKIADKIFKLSNIEKSYRTNNEISYTWEDHRVHKIIEW